MYGTGDRSVIWLHELFSAEEDSLLLLLLFGFGVVVVLVVLALTSVVNRSVILYCSVP